jgi:hypothetical protein
MALVSQLLETRNWSTLTGQSTRPGEDSTGAGAEREWGFGPQSKAEIAQGIQRSKRSTGTTRTHRPAAGWPGGVLRTQRTTQPSCELDVLF